MSTATPKLWRKELALPLMPTKIGELVATPKQFLTKSVYPPGLADMVCPDRLQRSNPDLWPFDLKTGMRVVSKVGNLPSKFGHAGPLRSVIVRYARDRQTDRRTNKSNAYCPFPTVGTVIMMKHSRCACDSTHILILNCTVDIVHCQFNLNKFIAKYSQSHIAYFNSIIGALDLTSKLATRHFIPTLCVNF